ncbi:MAG TPA: O-antigen ligase family protein [Terriglobales bacterium]|nr:O-antigen ligase family protein [Terriglobales bacterium]
MGVSGRPLAVLPPLTPVAAGPAAGGGRGLSGRASQTGYAAVVVFYVIYFFRPEDYIPGLSLVPIEKLVGGLALLAFAGAVLGQRFQSSREVILMALFLADLCLCIPTAVWPGGSFALVVNSFAKCVLVVLATICMADTPARCRRVMAILTLAMLLMAAFALGQPRELNRMYGIGQMFSDPNDFALNLCMILPFVAVFALTARSRLRRLFWLGGCGLAVLGVISTFSRGGFLALVATLLALAWRFRGPVRRVVVTAVVAGVVAALTLSGSSYMNRLSTILHPATDKTDSAQERQALFMRSLVVTLEHPLLGVGPGNFEIVSGVWHTTHNTYTELSAEAGIPALLLYLAIIGCGFRNVWAITEGAEAEVLLLAGGVQCALIGYLVGAVFLSTAYWLTPYLLVAFATILRRAAAAPAAAEEEEGAARGVAGVGGVFAGGLP